MGRVRGWSSNFGSLAVDPVDGTVWVTAVDYSDASAPVQVVAGFDGASGALVGSFAGGSGSPDSRFVCPSGVSAFGGLVFVLDSCKGRVDRYSSAGVFGATVDDGSRGAPVAVATDPVLGEVYVAESAAQGLQATHFTANGTSRVQTFSVAPVSMPVDGGPLRGFGVGPDATVYVGDVNTNRVERFVAFDGPTVTTDPVADPGETSAVLAGTIDPGGIQASYHYEWGLDTSYGHERPIRLTRGRAAVRCRRPSLWRGWIRTRPITIGLSDPIVRVRLWVRMGRLRPILRRRSWVPRWWLRRLPRAVCGCMARLTPTTVQRTSMSSTAPRPAMGRQPSMSLPGIRRPIPRSRRA